MKMLLKIYEAVIQKSNGDQDLVDDYLTAILDAVVNNKIEV